MKATRDVIGVDGIFRILGFFWAVGAFFQGTSLPTTMTTRVKQITFPSLLLKNPKPEKSSINIYEINEIIVRTMKVTISHCLHEKGETPENGPLVWVHSLGSQICV